MIDKELFPTEYKAIQRLKDNSKRFESAKKNRKTEKLKKVAEWREKLNAEYSGRRDS